MSDRPRLQTDAGPSVWRSVLRWLGLTDEARVQIRAPGLEVVITGEPEQVRSLLAVVKAELERSDRQRILHPGRRVTEANRATNSQVVQPTELDEMDSPYALPEAIVMPVREEDETTDESLTPPPGEADTPTGPRSDPSRPGPVAPSVSLAENLEEAPLSVPMADSNTDASDFEDFDPGSSGTEHDVPALRPAPAAERVGPPIDRTISQELFDPDGGPTLAQTSMASSNPPADPD